ACRDRIVQPRPGPAPAAPRRARSARPRRSHTVAQSISASCGLLGGAFPAVRGRPGCALSSVCGSEQRSRGWRDGRSTGDLTVRLRSLWQPRCCRRCSKSASPPGGSPAGWARAMGSVNYNRSQDDAKGVMASNSAHWRVCSVTKALLGEVDGRLVGIWRTEQKAPPVVEGVSNPPLERTEVMTDDRIARTPKSYVANPPQTYHT